MQKCDMIDLGDSMASRMDRYYNEKTKATRRSQKNRLLYQQIDDLMKYSVISENEEKLGTTRVERLFQNYDNYKEERKESHLRENRKYTFVDEDEENYNALKRMNQNTLENLKKYRLPRGITLEEDKKIKEMISTITTPSRYNQSTRLNGLRDLYASDEGKPQSKRSIESLLSEAKFLVQKKRNEFRLKEMNDIIHPYGEDKKEEMRKFNLKIRYTSGILFLLLSLVIFLLILHKIK